MPPYTAALRIAKFWAKVVKTDGCWHWTGGTAGAGYGTFWNGHKQEYVHRFSYELVKGPIPEGLTIDHLCKNTRCLNPDHLEAVTLRENVLRGDTFAARHAARTHCPQGHEYTAENTYRSTGSRVCRTCLLSPVNREKRKLSTRRWRARRAA